MDNASDAAENTFILTVLEDYGKYNFPQEKEIGFLNMTIPDMQISGIMQMTRLRRP